MIDPHQNFIKRRTFLNNAGMSFGSAALLSQLMKAEGIGSEYKGLTGLPHHEPKAKRVIFLCMAGGPSHLETFDYKPQLDKLDGKAMPESFTKGQPIAQLQGKELKVLGHTTKFKQYGKSGQFISDYLPHHQKMADDLTVIRSMVTEQINHDPAHTFMNTGTAISGRPSMGSWINYGLGSESEDLPGFVVLSSVGGRNPQPIASRQWASGFLPSRFQGVEFNSTGDPVHYVSNPNGVDRQQQSALIKTIQKLDAQRNELVDNPEIATRISAYEMAFRMQASVPELTDISGESKKTLEMYGATPGDGSYASNCLMARRLIEKGTRFVQLYHRGWDHHGDLDKYMKVCCRHTDQATYALLTDLKQRGLLNDTLVVWGGEFGRTPMFQGKGGPGRDHHIKGFSTWMAGGGVKAGLSYGATDELGYNAEKDIVHVRDFHATLLHLLGIDHHRFSKKFQGLDMRLTGVEPAKVVKGILS
ncbi:DUF1501 domain-containing protein [Akkermansiaceae bacterium]|nr:DUF1501 domain-containing protein [Akkermansiaceae bacterium]MDB4259739.1 DUF1501 domain-containing protein [Akkermansiaceae bacterium]